MRTARKIAAWAVVVVIGLPLILAGPIAEFGWREGLLCVGAGLAVAGSIVWAIWEITE